MVHSLTLAREPRRAARGARHPGDAAGAPGRGLRADRSRRSAATPIICPGDRDPAAGRSGGARARARGVADYDYRGLRLRQCGRVRRAGPAALAGAAARVRARARHRGGARRRRHRRRAHSGDDATTARACSRLPELADLRGKRVLIFRGDGGREQLGDTLRARGAHVDYVACYRRAAPAQRTRAGSPRRSREGRIARGDDHVERRSRQPVALADGADARGVARVPDVRAASAHRRACARRSGSPSSRPPAATPGSSPGC